MRFLSWNHARPQRLVRGVIFTAAPAVRDPAGAGPDLEGRGSYPPRGTVGGHAGLSVASGSRCLACGLVRRGTNSAEGLAKGGIMKSKCLIAVLCLMATAAVAQKPSNFSGTWQ